jgi:hypothetical protein
MVYVSCTQERKDNGINIFYHDKLDRILFLGFFMSSPITMGKFLKFLACLLTFRSEGRHWNINTEHCPPCKSKRHWLNRKTQQQISDGCKSWRDSCSASCQTTKTKRYKESHRDTVLFETKNLVVIQFTSLQLKVACWLLGNAIPVQFFPFLTCSLKPLHVCFPVLLLSLHIPWALISSIDQSSILQRNRLSFLDRLLCKTHLQLPAKGLDPCHFTETWLEKKEHALVKLPTSQF